MKTKPKGNPEPRRVALVLHDLKADGSLGKVVSNASFICTGTDCDDDCRRDFVHDDDIDIVSEAALTTVNRVFGR